MFDGLDSALESLRSAVAALQVDHVSGDAAARLLETFTACERVSAAGRTLAARKVEASKIWQRAGHRTAATWLAAKTGTSVGRAIGVLETAQRLDELPATREAFCSGQLSEVQTREVSCAATDRRSEHTLLETARTQTLRTLQAEARKIRFAGDGDRQRSYERIHNSRYFRDWIDSDGSVRLDAKLTPDIGANVVATVRARQARIEAEARRQGRREPSAAYAADALVELAAETSSTPSPGPRAMVHVVVDHDVLVSGMHRPDQRCEIPGVGPIPVASARALTGDAIIKAVVAKGSDIRSVVNVGRTVPTLVRTALELRDPTCVVPGCDSRDGLEIDHFRVRYADGGPTKLDNLARLCRWHHYLKTRMGYRLGGGPGEWIWLIPDDIDGSARPPPDG